jgi:hypothetical protein
MERVTGIGGVFFKANASSFNDLHVFLPGVRELSGLDSLGGRCRRQRLRLEVV